MNETSENNSISRIVFDWIVPIDIFCFYFLFFNYGKVTETGIIKATGLVGILLLAITLVIGPLSRFFQSINFIKANRKFWGIASVVFVAIHALLVFGGYFNFSISILFNAISQKSIGLISGLISLLILFIVTATSFHFFMRHLNHATWKKIQNTSYIALFFALLHFFFIEQKAFSFTFNHVLETVPFWLSTIALFLRIIVYYFPKKITITSTAP